MDNKSRRAKTDKLVDDISATIDGFLGLDRFSKELIIREMGWRDFNEIYESVARLATLRHVIDSLKKTKIFNSSSHYKFREIWINQMGYIYLEFFDDFLSTTESSPFIRFLKLAQPTILKESGWGEPLSRRQVRRYLSNGPHRSHLKKPMLRSRHKGSRNIFKDI